MLKINNFSGLCDVGIPYALGKGYIKSMEGAVMNMLRIVCATLGLGICFQVVAASQDEEGYFLPWSQKGNLIWRGAVEGGDGT